MSQTEQIHADAQGAIENGAPKTKSRRPASTDALSLSLSPFPIPLLDLINDLPHSQCPRYYVLDFTDDDEGVQCRAAADEYACHL